jgi:hypothetical protein
MMKMFSSKINYEENFSDAQYNPLDVDDETKYLWEFERGENPLVYLVENMKGVKDVYGHSGK